MCENSDEIDAKIARCQRMLDGLTRSSQSPSSMPLSRSWKPKKAACTRHQSSKRLTAGRLDRVALFCPRLQLVLRAQGLLGCYVAQEAASEWYAAEPRPAIGSRKRGRVEAI